MPWTGERRLRLPPDWRARRKAVLRRDQGVCQIRGPHCTVRALEVDHVVNDDDHDLSNLQAACVPCHKEKTAGEALAGKPSRRRSPERHPGLLA